MIEDLFLASADTYIVENDSTPYGDDPGMGAGATSGGTVLRSLVGFPVTWRSGPIVSAHLQLYYRAYETGTGMHDPVGRSIKVNTLLKPFVESEAGWISPRYGQYYWDEPGAGGVGTDYDPNNGAFASVPPASASGPDRWMDWDVSKQIRVLQQQQPGNVYFRIVAATEAAGYLPVWDQKEYLGAARLFINYGSCVPGETKCEGVDLYTCDATGEWQLTKIDSPTCGGGCTPGTTKCVGGDLFTCSSDRVWELTEPNSPQCGGGGECTPGETKCVGVDLYTCDGSGQWQLLEANSPQCGGGGGGGCTPGETKCVGVDLYTCNGSGQWELTEPNSPQCGGGNGGGVGMDWKWIGLGIGAIVVLLIAKLRPKRSK